MRLKRNNHCRYCAAYNRVDGHESRINDETTYLKITLVIFKDFWHGFQDEKSVIKIATRGRTGQWIGEVFIPLTG